MKRVFGMQWRWFYFVAGILRIYGATGGWTVWALSGDQRIAHVLKIRKEIQLMYRIPRCEWTLFACQTVPIGWGKVIIWLSDSPNWAWEVCDLLSELTRTHGGSHGEYTVIWSDRNYLGTRPGILASTCKAFDFCLCNPRVSGRGGSGPGRLSGMPRECTRITAK